MRDWLIVFERWVVRSLGVALGKEVIQVWRLLPSEGESWR